MIKALFLAFVVLAILAIKLLPWWGSVALVLGFALMLKVLGGRILAGLFRAPFKAKGAALRGAEAVVHHIEAASAPPIEEVDEELRRELEAERAGCSYYWIDATITPKNADSKFTHWEPGELVVASPIANMDTDELTQVETVEVFKDGAFVPDDDFKYEGSRRLRLLVAVKPPAGPMCFHYYFEKFGQFQLPG